MEVEETYVLTSQMLGELAEKFNLFTALEPAPLLGVPTLMSTQMTTEQPFGPRAEMVVASILAMLGWVFFLTLLGLGFNALYLRMVGRHVIDETEMPFDGPRGLFGVWGQLLLFLLIVLVALCMFSTVAIAFMAFLSLLSFSLVGFVMMLLFSIVLFVAFHMVFAIPGMVQLRRSPLRAIRESFLIMRSDFLKTTFLVLLISVISRGFNVVWSLPDPGTWMNLIGIAGHAFVSTALTAALFVFYQERLSLISKPQEAQKAQETAVHPVAGE